jgi:hypothetical protein
MVRFLYFVRKGERILGELHMQMDTITVKGKELLEATPAMRNDMQ